MSDLQRALAETLHRTIVERRLRGRLLTEKERAYAVVVAMELGLLETTP